jgi:hypothetical protein
LAAVEVEVLFKALAVGLLVVEAVLADIAVL